MTLLTRPIPSLIGGVSQQSPLVRSPEQLESQINGWSSIADGLAKRAPTEFVAKLLETAPANAHVHVINRDTDEQYVVITTAGSIRVFATETGVEQTVAAPGGLTYLSSVVNFAEDMAMMTVADYTFVVNRRAVCAMAEAGTDLVADPDHYIWSNREIGIDDYGVPFRPGGAYQYRPNLTTGALTGTVQRFDKLPEAAAEGAVYRISGDESSGFVSYYVVKRGGVWEECVKPGLINAIDAETMPHALVREADGTFTFAPFSWAPRRVGDGDINPNPGFIGRSIRKPLFYQNRLGFLYDENVILSVSGDFGNFWRMSQTDYLDSDVLDVGATSTKVSRLFDATTHNDGILLTSDQTQFSLTNGEIGLTAVSIAIRPTTNFTLNTKAGLTPLGSEVYFAVENNGWAQIREYQRLAGADATTAANVTAHVPRYIPAGVHAMIAADDLNSLFVLTDGAPSKVFVYQFYWTSSDEKAQSAWHEWDFGAGVTVVAGAYLKGTLYLAMKRSDGLYLERIDLQSGALPDHASSQVHLDRRCYLTGEYVGAENRTEFNLPYAPDQARFQIVRGDDFDGLVHTLADPASYVWITSTRVAIPGHQLSGPMIAGESYDFAFEFSTQYLRKQGGEAITSGRLQLRTFTVSYSETGYFRTSVAPYGTDPNVEEILPAYLDQMTGKTLGSQSLKLNTPAFHTGAYTFTVLGSNTQATIAINNPTHVSSTFVAAEWEALYNNRARF